ncbi:hypothetical protein HDC94_002240 [Leifsonia sp. AK011]|uniref:hypothetical protein n=1 Tax=Leifsonia sp. AK011 TaxID=2723075 RepID=UPI0015CBD57C|nr:hypothetical protein [Leifsonia sp. AK011]NYF11084.1 hypothetical protein [Leifsonia sp. AK011]
MTITQSTPQLMPILSAGRHRNASRGACFMEYASFLAGERWSDRPACTHPLLASLARDVNDLTTDAHRGELLPLVPRVVGLNPASELYSAEVAVLAASAALPIASMERQRALAAGLISLVRRAEDDRLERIAEESLAQVPDIQRWAQRYLNEVYSARGSWTHAAEAIVHTSTVGIALACVADPESQLKDLLVAAIQAGERMTQRVGITPDRLLVDS